MPITPLMARDRDDPLDAGMLSRLAPFAALTIGALVLAAPWSGTRATYFQYAAVWAIMATVGATALLGGDSSPTWLRLARSLLYLAGIGVLREATGGAGGGLGILVLVPVVWIALYGTPRMLTGILIGVALVWALPLIAIGAPRYPSTGWRSCVLTVALSGIIGLTVQRLVRQTRAQAEHARRHVRERERLLAQVNKLAHTDPLTGAANRRSWEERFTAELDAALGPVSVVVLDLDRFKALNDSLGHEEGDRCLRENATAWAAQLRPHDLLARLGGDEFAILLPACPLDHARVVAERVRAATVATTCSIGVAQWDGQESAQELQRRADGMLYADKRGTARAPVLS